MKKWLFLEKVMWGILTALALTAFPFAYWAATPDEILIIDGDPIETKEVVKTETIVLSHDTVLQSYVQCKLTNTSSTASTVPLLQELGGDTPHPSAELTPSPQGEGRFSDRDIDLIARCVWLEARGENYDGQVAVAEVILNRVASDSYPNTVEGVIRQPGQFTSAAAMGRAAPTEVQYSAVYDAIEGRGVLLNERCVFFSVGRSCGTYYTAIGNHVFGCE